MLSEPSCVLKLLEFSQAFVALITLIYLTKAKQLFAYRKNVLLNTVCVWDLKIAGV